MYIQLYSKSKGLESNGRECIYVERGKAHTLKAPHFHPNVVAICFVNPLSPAEEFPWQPCWNARIEHAQ